MLNKKIKRIIFGMPVVILPLATVISCSNSLEFNSWVGSKKHLKTTLVKKEGNILAKWYKTSGAFSNLDSTIGLADTQARLISNWYYKKSNALGEITIKYKKLRLAKSITIKYTEDGIEKTKIFSNDNIDKNDVESVNGDFFKNLIKNKRTITSITFKVRDGVNWVNHKGEKTKYELTNKDFLRGFRFQIYNLITELRYKLQNPDLWKGNPNDTPISALENKIRKHTEKKWFKAKSIDNGYLFELAGIHPEDFYGMNYKNGEMQKDNQILKSNNKLYFKFKGKDTRALIFLDFLTSDHNVPFSPVPSEYIDSLSVDEYSLPKTNKLGKIGFYKWGRTFDKMLYASPYYVSRNDLNTFEVTKNKHYAVKEIREDSKAVEKHTTFIIKSIDASSAGLQNYNRFKEGVDYFVPSTNIDSLKKSNKINIYKNHANILVKNDELHPRKIPTILRWIILPKIYGPNKKPLEKRFYNDNFVKVMFGKTSSEIESNPNLISILKHSTTKASIFKSLLHGAINWQAFMSQAYGGDGIYWPLGIAPGSTVGTKIAIDAFAPNGKMDFRTLKWDSTSQKPVDGITIETNKDYKIATTESNPKKLWRSHAFINIKKQMDILLSSIFPGTEEKTIQFALPIGGETKATDQIAYKMIANTIESLSSDRFKLKIIEVGRTPRDQYAPIAETEITRLREGDGTHDYNGWSSDYDDAFGMLAGLFLSSDRRHWVWSTLLPYFAKEEAKDNSIFDEIYPKTLKLAKWYAEKFKIQIKLDVDKILSEWPNGDNEKVEYISKLDMENLKNLKFSDLIGDNDNYSKMAAGNSWFKFSDAILSTKFKVQKEIFDQKIKSKEHEASPLYEEIQKIFDSYPETKFTKWVLEIQSQKDIGGVFEEANIQSDIETLIKEIEIINGTPLQIAKYEKSGVDASYVVDIKKSTRSSAIKPWLKMTNPRSGYYLISEWEIS